MSKLKLYLKLIVALVILLPVSSCTNNSEKEETVYGYNLNDLITNYFFKVDSSGNTVTYHSYGLEWKKCSQGQSYRPGFSDCKGTNLLDMNDYGAIQLQFCTSDDNKCNTTTLPMILNSFSSPAFLSCELEALNGKTDWRVPTLQEMETILKSNRATFLETFPDTPDSYYWTSNADLTSENLGYTRAVAISFKAMEFGERFSFNKSSSNYVRCVRDLP